MKRIGVIACLAIMVISMLAPSCFAAEDKAPSSDGTNFSITKSTPSDGDKNVSVENLSVKIRFDTDMLPDKSTRKYNAKQFALTDSKGKKIPIKVYYSHKEKGLVMVVSDIIGKDIKIDGNKNYTLHISKDLKSADGTKMGADQEITFKTLDQAGSTKVYMILMGVMIVGMIFFTSRSTKKAMEKEKESSGKAEHVNPYKEAKRTGKSVEEIVERENKKRAKLEAEEAKKQAQIKELEEEEMARIKALSNKRVSKARPISAAGSTYKVEVVKTNKPEQKKSTNPKNQSGKQKNSKNKGKKKK